MNDPRSITLTIDDDEIRTLMPADKFEMIIDELDRDPATQKYEAMYHGKRNRESVMKWMKAKGYVA